MDICVYVCVRNESLVFDFSCSHMNKVSELYLIMDGWMARTSFEK